MNVLRNKKRGHSIVLKIYVWAEQRVITGATNFMRPIHMPPVVPQHFQIPASVMRVPTTPPPPPPAPAARVPIPSPASLIPPSLELIHPDPGDPVLDRPHWLPRLPAPATFLAGRRLAPHSSRSRLSLIVNHLVNTVVNYISGKTTNYCQLIRGPDRYIWLLGMANDLGRLS